MSKYIDLYEEITEGEYTTVDYRRGVIDTLGFLDRNPVQVPGRTITMGEVLRFTRNVSDRYARGVNAGLILAGVEIVPGPDPEPTNAEKWDAIVDEWRKTVSPYPSSASFGEWMDQRGVKAPNHD